MQESESASEAKVEAPVAKVFPTAFTDLEKREWRVEFRPSIVAKLKATVGIDIWQANDTSPTGPLVVLAADEQKLIATLWLLCESQASEQGVTRPQFEDGFAGIVFDNALEAIQGATLCFFSGARAAQLRNVLTLWQLARDKNVKTLAELEGIAAEVREKAAETAKANFRTQLETEVPKFIARETKRLISSAFTEKPAAPSA